MLPETRFKNNVAIFSGYTNYNNYYELMLIIIVHVSMKMATLSLKRVLLYIGLFVRHCVRDRF